MPFDLKPKQNIGHVSQKGLQQRSARFDYQETISHEEEWISEEQAIPDSAGNVIHKWKGPEFEKYERTMRWYLVGTVFIALLVIYALYTGSPIMAITFILIGVIGFIYSQKEPRTINFAITSKGIFADKELYLYENIYSFWIFYDPSHTKVISLHTKATMLPYVHVPLGNEDPVIMRRMLLKHIPEIKQDPSLIDALERFLHI